MSENISELTTGEQDWIQSQLKITNTFIRTYLGEEPNQLPSLQSIDQAWMAWMEENESDMEMVNGIINAVGIAFGQHLVNDGLFQWVIATDEYGSDLAIYGLPEHGDILVYPTNFVAKRYERGEIDFLMRSYEEIISQAQSLLKEPSN